MDENQIPLLSCPAFLDLKITKASISLCVIRQCKFAHINNVWLLGYLLTRCSSRRIRPFLNLMSIKLSSSQSCSALASSPASLNVGLQFLFGFHV
ncbi:unnamed protein product [Triticum turgidum subsp. durum]|uniref:Uncharacterized protein n=1 Tax=Triticum turgidum subsp. durum TaxID=4567 RepID=A0A9R0VT43_TRITD|nr:unnamed protein product [Triticum turgidum subsp. durum]